MNGYIKLIESIYERISVDEDLKKEEAYDKWLEEILDPFYNFIHDLVKLLESLTYTGDKKKKIFKVLAFLLRNRKQQTIAQLKKNDGIAEMLTRYISNSTSRLMIDQNAFFTLTIIFEKNEFDPFIDEKFIQALYKSLDMLDEEDVFENVIDIILQINYLFKKKGIDPKDNLICKNYFDSDNSKLINEVILRGLKNETEKIKVFNIINFIENLILHENSIFFSKSDYEYFIDGLKNKLKKTYNNVMREKLIEVIDIITNFDRFYKDEYGIFEIVERMDKYIKIVNEPTKEKCKKISEKIIGKLKSILKDKYLDNYTGEEEEEIDEEEEEEEEEEKEN